MSARREPETLADVLRWLESAPDGTTLQARAVLELLQRLGAVLTVDSGAATTAAPPSAAATWRERVWVAPPETRLTVGDVAEAVGRAKSWVYRHTSPASGLPRLPHRKLDGELVFVAGEVREWLRGHEEILVQPSIVVPIHAARAPRRDRPARSRQAR